MQPQVRSAASLMPRRSVRPRPAALRPAAPHRLLRARPCHPCGPTLQPRDRLTTFQEYHEAKYGLRVAHSALPLLTVGVHLCTHNCRVDAAHASVHDHFGTARDEARARWPAAAARVYPRPGAVSAPRGGRRSSLPPAWRRALWPPRELAGEEPPWRTGRGSLSALRSPLASASAVPEQAEQLRHHTFLVAEHAVLLGLTAEMSASYCSVLLPEVAWNLAVWRRLATLEQSLGSPARSDRRLA